MSETTHDGAPEVVNQTYDLVLWLLPKVEKFSKAFRFTVGERLSANGLDLLTLTVEAAYTRKKTSGCWKRRTGK